MAGMMVLTLINTGDRRGAAWWEPHGGACCTGDACSRCAWRRRRPARWNCAPGDRLADLAARFTPERFEKLQVRAPKSAPEQLPSHHHALDLVGALVDLGDRGPAGSFCR
jgi:hypothetical protein